MYGGGRGEGEEGMLDTKKLWGRKGAGGCLPCRHNSTSHTQAHITTCNRQPPANNKQQRTQQKQQRDSEPARPAAHQHLHLALINITIIIPITDLSQHVTAVTRAKLHSEPWPLINARSIFNRTEPNQTQSSESSQSRRVASPTRSSSSNIIITSWRAHLQSKSLKSAL